MVGRDDAWDRLRLCPERPLAVSELAALEAAYDGPVTMWFAAGPKIDGASELDTVDTRSQVVDNVVVVTETAWYQYRMRGSCWWLRGPYTGEDDVTTRVKTDAEFWVARDAVQDNEQASSPPAAGNDKWCDPSEVDWVETTVLPATPADPATLLDLAAHVETVYQATASVWVQPNQINRKRAQTRPADHEECLAERCVVEVAGVYHWFQFDSDRSVWVARGPIPMNTANTRPVDKDCTTLELVIVETPSGWRWAGSQAGRTVVSIEEITPYSLLDVTADDRAQLVDAVDEYLRAVRETAEETQPLADALAELRERIHDASSPLQLDVGEHDRLQSALRQATTATTTIEQRLTAAEPDCTFGCSTPAYQHVRIDDGPAHAICAECKAALVSGSDHHVVTKLAPTDSVNEPVVFNWPGESLDETIQQTTLTDYC